MADININFIVQDGGEGAGGKTASTAKKTKTQQEKDNAKTALSVNMALNVAKQLSTQVFDGAIEAWGENTGNLAQMRQIQNAKAVATKLVGVGLAFVANPVLGAVSLVSTGIGEAFEYARIQRENQWQNRSAQELARRAGFNSNYNR